MPCSLKGIEKQQQISIVNNMRISLPLQEMSLADKIRTMEDIWTDLSQSKSGYTPPVWHDEVLKIRKERLEAGEIGHTDWEDAKKEILKRVS